MEIPRVHSSQMGFICNYKLKLYIYKFYFTYLVGAQICPHCHRRDSSLQLISWNRRDGKGPLLRRCI
jgi:hypothetical protein